MNQIENIHSIKKPVSAPIATLTLSLLTALVLTTVLNGYVDLKSTFSNLSAVENYSSLSANVVNANNVTVDKWHPGIYVKIEDWQLQNPAQMEAIYNELAATPQLRGIKVTLHWGRYETKDEVTGDITYDFSEFDSILSRLATLDDKHMILSFAWREFQSTSGADDILPNDLRNGVLWSEDPTWEHIDFDYLWAYKMSNVAGSYGYNLKLWDPTIMARLDAFFNALADHLDTHPNLTQIATTESVIGNPVIPFVAGEGRDEQYVGQLSVLRMLKKHFINTIVLAGINFDRSFVAEAVPIFLNEGIGVGSPNSNLHFGLNTTGTPPGVLTYYPNLSGKLVLAPEIQGDDYRSTYGAGGEVDNPPYDYLYNRVKNDLKANYVVMQRNTPYWLGGTIKNTTTTVPSMLEFIQTYPDIVNDPTGAGGLDHLKPTMLNTEVTPPPPSLPMPDLSFNASPTEVLIGESAVLTWSATNSTACEATGAWSGAKSLEGTESVDNILSASTFNLTCSGDNGSVAKNVTVNIKADAELPSAPSDLSYINVGTDSVTLNWSSATDNIAVTGYNIYRDGVKINTVTDTTYTDSSLGSGNTYTYTVTAIDGAGNESVPSSSVNVTTVVVAPFEISSYSATGVTRNSATINVALSKIGNVTINYGRFSSNLNLTKSSADLNVNHSVLLSGLDRDKTYYYQIIATDEGGNTITSPTATFKTRK